MRELKNSIRQILRQRKEAMIPENRLEKSKRVCYHLMTLIQDGETVMVYTSKEKEVNTTPLITTLFENGNPVIVPIIVKDDISLRLSYLRDFSVLCAEVRLAFLNLSGMKSLPQEKMWTRSSFPCLGLTGLAGEWGMVLAIMTGS